jgi:hypothetical protein
MAEYEAETAYIFQRCAELIYEYQIKPLESHIAFD